MKLIFFGTNEFAVPALLALKKKFDISLVITKPAKPVGRQQIIQPSAVEAEAKKLGLLIIPPESFDDKLITAIEAINPSFFVVVDYGKIIPQKILNMPPRGVINIHPSKLPKYRGASPLQSAILNGESKTAITIMMIDKEMDHGPILAQKDVDIFSDDTYKSLYERLSHEYPDFLIDTLKKYLAGQIEPQEQNHKQATFTKILSRKDGKIDWSKSAEEIERMVRAYNPWPGAYTEVGSPGYLTSPKSSALAENPCLANNGGRVSHSALKRLKILEVSISSKNHSNKKIGELFLTTDKHLAAQCGQGILILDQVQPEGKRPMSGEEFARGYLK